jgi:hypothetical protein
VSAAASSDQRSREPRLRRLGCPACGRNAGRWGESVVIHRVGYHAHCAVYRAAATRAGSRAQ